MIELLIVGLSAFLLGLIIGCNAAGSIAYDEGVRDEKAHWYIHAHNWWHDKDEYIEND